MKPFTHMYIMNVVIKDAKDNNGMLNIPPYGKFKISDIYKRAIDNEDCHEYFRAGAIGPDAFPDLVTGQSIVHPETDRWYSYMSHFMQGENDLKTWAFYAGYKSHLVTDTWTHDWVNYYSGGCWPETSKLLKGDKTAWENIAIHTAIETSVDMHVRSKNRDGMPKTVSIPKDFIFKLLINSNQNYLEQNSKILKGDDGALFVSIFSDFVDLYWDTKGYEHAKSVMLYVKEWHKDIDRGLKAWIACNEKAIKDAMENNKGMFESIKEQWKKWGIEHYASMKGAPDMIAKLPSAIGKVLDALSIEIFEKMEKFVADKLCQMFTGMTVDEFKDFYKTEFKKELFEKALGLTTCNQVLDEIKTVPKLSQWQQDSISENTNSAVNNSVISTKMILLSDSELKRLAKEAEKGKDKITLKYLDIVKKIRAIDCGGQFLHGDFKEFYDDMDGQSFSIYSSYCKNKKCSHNGSCKINPASDIQISDTLRTIQTKIKTKNKLWAGTDGDVHFGIKFKDGSHSDFKLDKPYYNDFERGDNDLYYMNAKSDNKKISEIDSIYLKLTGRNDEWNCQDLSLSLNNRSFKKYSVNKNFKKNHKWEHKI